MEFFKKNELDYIIKSAQQYEFLLYTSVISEIEKNINAIKEDVSDSFFVFSEKHCSLNISKINEINFLNVQPSEWEDEYDPMHIYSELNGVMDSIYFSFSCMDKTLVKERFESYKHILLSLTEKYDSLSKKTVEDFYLYLKENKEFDYNHHTQSHYDLPICIPNENMSRKFNKWQQSFKYENSIDDFILKIAKTICYNMEKDFKITGNCAFSKKDIYENHVISEIDEMLPASAKKFKEKIKSYFKYNNQINFKNLDQDSIIRSQQYVKIISDMTNGSSQIENNDVLQIIIEVEKDLIHKNLEQTNINELSVTQKKRL